MTTQGIRVRAAGLAVIGAVAMLAGCSPDVKDLRAQGIREFRNRQHLESMATMRHVLELAPNDAQANYYMGLNYRVNAERKFKEGDYVGARRQLDSAIVYFTQAVKSWPNYMAAVAAKAEAFELRGKYDEAIATAEYVSNNNRGVAEHYIYLGNEYRNRGDYDNALRAYKLALGADGGSISAYQAMGELYTRIGDTAQASDAFARAEELRSNPKGKPANQAEVASPPSEPQPKPQPTRSEP